MDFEFRYRITYASGQFYDRPHQMRVEIPKEEYRRIIQGICEGKEISAIQDIPEAIAKMTQMVQCTDRLINMNGSQRTTPLKKARAIVDIEFFLPETEYRRIMNLKDPIAVLDQPEEHMTIYRTDGSSVKISNENGKVKIFDSRHKNTTLTRDADYFLSLIT